jgi:hypothetical protein
MQNLNLTIRKNKLVNIVCYEPVDISILDMLINSNLLQKYVHKETNKQYDNELKHLILYKNIINDDGNAVVQYTLNCMFGRSNARGSLGLHCIRKKIRHTLNSGWCDIDIENAHPCFLSQIMTANNIDCECLLDYIDNRDEWLKMVNEYYEVSKCDYALRDPNYVRKMCKTLFIQLMYGGLCEAWAKKTWSTELIDGEVRIIKGVDLSLPIHPKIIQMR